MTHFPNDEFEDIVELQPVTSHSEPVNDTTTTTTTIPPFQDISASSSQLIQQQETKRLARFEHNSKFVHLIHRDNTYDELDFAMKMVRQVHGRMETIRNKPFDQFPDRVQYIRAELNAYLNRTGARDVKE